MKNDFEREIFSWREMIEFKSLNECMNWIDFSFGVINYSYY